MTKVIETFSSYTEWPNHTPQQTVEKLVAMGWEVEEQKTDRTVLRHDLIPGATRVVLQP